MEIKPCPVCDGAAIVEDDSNDERRASWVACNNDGRCLIGPTLETEAEAIAAWNRLSDAAALLRAVERLEAGLVEGHHELAIWESLSGFTVAALPFRVSGPEPLCQTHSPESLAAALIALGGGE